MGIGSDTENHTLHSSSNIKQEGVSAADGITKIYACATMWHETATETLCILKSILRLDEDQCARRNAQKYLRSVDHDYYEFEAHIFFDDAFNRNEYGEPTVNEYVQTFIEKVQESARDVHQTQMRLRPPKKMGTPYGGRLVWTLPGKNKLTVHLKDKSRIRNKKRWSQIMYMYYLLGYKLMHNVDDQAKKEMMSENTYLLALDGDVDFKPSCVQLLVDLMKRDQSLGAACGRIHPRGTGLLVQYQKFEYAIGHWFQKATEHVFGCVLCSPGCFSLFRACALMDDNVIQQYAKKSQKPRDYVQYDQGEDRWLCTLLLQRGYRVEYCAASDALTFAPEEFNEFFNQRRRWIPSTMSNIMDLLADYKNVVKVNESVSILYIFYQLLMLISSIIGPGTVFLTVVGAIGLCFKTEDTTSFIVVTIPILIFCIVCMTCKPDTQLLVAQILSALFALLMTAVTVGFILLIRFNGILSPTVLFLIAVSLCFIIAAILHPSEFSCILSGIVYWLAIPCMYLLLPIYSICNLNVVSWGTRETPKTDMETETQQASGSKHGLLEAAGLNHNRVNEMQSVGCSNIGRFLCCTQTEGFSNGKLSYQLDQVEKKMDQLFEQSLTGAYKTTNKESQLYQQDDKVDSVETEPLITDKDLDDLSQDEDTLYYEEVDISEAWLHQPCLYRARRDYMELQEEKFWNGVIKKYLFPLSVEKSDQDHVKAGLLNLRNRATFTFFMLNAFFILIVFLLQMQKSCIHVTWPVGPYHNRTMVPCNPQVDGKVWVYSREQAEPISIVFLVFFISILGLQFVGMLFHRFNTLSHVLAATELFCVRKRRGKISDDEFLAGENAVEIARELQAIKGIDDTDPSTPVEKQQISRRRVVRNIEKNRKQSMKGKQMETLDKAFRIRFTALREQPEAAVEKSLQRLASTRKNSRFAKSSVYQGTIRALRQKANSSNLRHMEKHEAPETPFTAEGTYINGAFDEIGLHPIKEKENEDQRVTTTDDDMLSSDDSDDDLEQQRPRFLSRKNHDTNTIGQQQGQMQAKRGLRRIYLPKHAETHLGPPQRKFGLPPAPRLRRFNVNDNRSGYMQGPHGFHPQVDRAPSTAHRRVYPNDSNSSYDQMIPNLHQPLGRLTRARHTGQLQTRESPIGSSSSSASKTSADMIFRHRFNSTASQCLVLL